MIKSAAVDARLVCVGDSVSGLETDVEVGAGSVEVGAGSVEVGAGPGVVTSEDSGVGEEHAETSKTAAHTAPVETRNSLAAMLETVSTASATTSSRGGGPNLLLR